MNIDILVLGFYTVCKLTEETTVREPLWVPSEHLSSRLLTSEDGTHNGSRNVVY
jgi:hypothetical protein